ncbi:helix-turn-helix domain-containing protein [Myxococcota bacterium]|nr:helix-turn-helix domain-containing protein [Myxococcota bacterium]
MDTKKQTNLPTPLSESDFERIYAEEGLVVDVMEQIAGWMEDHQISRAELARRLGTSPANITQMLRGRNVSLRTLASTVHVMGGVVNLSIREWKEKDSYRSPLVASSTGGAIVYQFQTQHCRRSPAVDHSNGDALAGCTG